MEIPECPECWLGPTGKRGGKEVRRAEADEVRQAPKERVFIEHQPCFSQ